MATAERAERRKAGADARRRRTGLAAAASVGAHLLLIPLAVLGTRATPEAMIEFDPIPVTLASPPAPPSPPTPPRDEPAPAAGPPAPQPAAAPRPAPPIRLHRTPPAPADVAPLPAPPPSPPAPPAPFPQLTSAQLTGARTAGGGGGSGGGGEGTGAGAGCDMVRRLESALKRDPEVMAAVSSAASEGDAGGALFVWNGDWVRSPRQEGKGLAGVRQAIALEVAFAPDACRKEAMRGLVLLSLNDRARVALGADAWRWTDLLGARR